MHLACWFVRITPYYIAKPVFYCVSLCNMKGFDQFLVNFWDSAGAWQTLGFGIKGLGSRLFGNLDQKFP